MDQYPKTNTLIPNCSPYFASSEARQSRGVCVRNCVGTREVLNVILSVRLVVGRILSLSVGLIVIMSGGLGIF